MKKLIWLAILLFCGVLASAENESRYTDNKNGTVTDFKTGLIWQKKDGGKMNWEEAKNYCTNLSLTGQSWRLPDSEELESLVDDKRYKPAINTYYFPNTPSDWFWSSTPLAYGSSDAWVVRFIYGDTEYNDKSHKNFVRCQYDWPALIPAIDDLKEKIGFFRA